MVEWLAAFRSAERTGAAELLAEKEEIICSRRTDKA